jgi:hypothetical protein
LKVAADMILNQHGGGRWIYPVQLEATEPDIDGILKELFITNYIVDIITIESVVGKTAGVSFRLRNQFDYPIHYEAYFTKDSPTSFKIAPRNGIMEPTLPEESGTLFKIAFSPTFFATADLVGKLVIVSEEMEWSYKVFGRTSTQTTETDETTKKLSRSTRQV